MNKTMGFEPGARMMLISKANVCYEGTLVSVDKEKDKIALAHVLSFGDADTKAPSTTAAGHFVYGYVVFRQSELKEVKILDATNPWPTDDSAIVRAVTDCTESQATTFTNEVLSWIEQGKNEKINLILDYSHLHQAFDATERTLLHYAVEYDNVTVVEKLLTLGLDMDAQDSMGMTPLMMAMEKQKSNKKASSTIVEVLLDAQDTMGFTSWLMAMEKEKSNKKARLKIVEVLLAAKADILVLNKERRSAVHMFCDEYEDLFEIGKAFFASLRTKCPLGDDEVDILVDAGCSLYQVYNYLEDLRTLELMLQRGLPVDKLDSVLEISVLHSAVRLEDVECIQLLMSYGANVEVKNGEGETPLSDLHQYGDVIPEIEEKIVQLLLEHGASPTMSTSEFQLRQSLVQGNKNVIRTILKHNFDWTATDNLHKRYALQFLTLNTNPGVVEELKVWKSEIKVNVRDGKGAAPIHWAAKYANVEMLEFFLSIGAEVDAVHATKGFTPLHYTCTGPRFPSRKKKPSDYDKCAELLLQHYADPQFVVARAANGEPITVFEATFTAANVNRTKAFVAQMAILEGLGTPITENIQRKINANLALAQHLEGCRRLLREEISGSLTLFKLLTSDKKKMAKLLNNRDLILKLDGNYIALRSFSSFYGNTLKKRYSDGALYKTLKSKAAVSVCKILEECVDEENIIVDRIIDLLDDKSLECLGDLLSES